MSASPLRYTFLELHSLCCLGLHAGLHGFWAQNCIFLLVWSPPWKKKAWGGGVSFNFVEAMAWLFFFLILLCSFVFSCILFALPNFSYCLLLTFLLVVQSIFIACKYNTYSCSFSYNASCTVKAYLHFPYIFLSS